MQGSLAGPGWSIHLWLKLILQRILLPDDGGISVDVIRLERRPK